MNEQAIKGMCLGTLLGDASLNGNVLRCEHTSKQRYYVEWKHSLLAPHGTKATIRHDVLKHTTFGDVTYSLCRVCLQPELASVLRAGYVAGAKCFTLETLRALTPLGLLLLWLDDGCLSVHRKVKANGLYSVSRCGYLATHGLPTDCRRNLALVLQESFGIHTAEHSDNSGIYPDRRYVRLYLNATAMRTLIDVVRKYIKLVPTNMLYKLNMQYEPNRLSDSGLFAERYNFGRAKRPEALLSGQLGR